MKENDRTNEECIKELETLRKQVAELNKMKQEHKYAEEALRQERDKAQNFLDIAGVIMVALNAKGEVTLINKKGCEVLGYAKEEIIGRDWFSNFIPKGIRLAVKVVFHHLMEGKIKPVEYFENPILTKSGQERIIVWHNTFVNDTEGRTIGTLSSGEDITELKMAEVVFQNNIKKYRSIFETASDLIILVDKNGIVIDCNLRIMQILGFKRNEIIGHDLSEFIHTDNTGIDNEFLKETYIKPFSYNHECEMIRKEGSLVDVNINSAALSDEKGEFSTTVCIITNISERKKAKEALVYKSEFEKLITTLSSSFIYLSTDEIGKGINDALQKIGKFAGVDRSYVFQFHDNIKKLSKTHEWCAEGIEPEINNLQNVSVERLLWWMERLNRFETIYISCVADLPPEATAEKEILLAQGIQSLIIIPMVVRGSLMGFVGFDSVREEKTWSEDIITLLSIVGDIFANALDRKRAQEALQKEKEYYSSFMESLNEWVWEMDLNGIHTYSNPAVEEILGYTVDEVIDSSATKLWLEEEKTPQNLESFKKSLLSGKGWKDFQCKFKHKNGSEVIMETSAIPIFDSDNRLVGYRGIDRDITIRKCAEDALRESEERFRDISHSMADWIWEVDANGRYTFASGKVRPILGYDPEELIGKTPFELMPEDEAVRAEKIFKKIASEKKPIVGWENWNLNKNGKKVCLLTNGVPILDDQGNLKGYRGVDKDITDRKKTEEELERYRKHLEDLVVERTRELEKAQDELIQKEKLATLGKISGSIAHEIRNPLTAIKNSADLINLVMIKQGIEDERLQKYLEIMKQETNRIERIIENMVEFRKKRLPAREPVDIRVVFDKVIKDIAPHERVEIVKEFEGPPQAYVDPFHLETILKNIFRNAIQSIRGEDTEVSGTGTVKISSKKEGDQIVLSIIDDGPGMTEEVKNRIFEPLYSTKVEGMGFGLAVVKDLVNANKGTIEVESEVGKGATFTLYLPLSPPTFS